MWQPVKLPRVPGDLRAVAVPWDGTMFVLTDAGLYRVRLRGRRGPTAHRVTSPDRAERRIAGGKGRLLWHGIHYHVLGPDYPAPPDELEPAHPTGERVEVDHKAGVVRVVAPGGDVRLAIDDYPAGAPGAAAGFVDGGDYLLVAQPGRVRLFRHAPDPAGTRPKWAAAGTAREQAGLLAAVLAAPDDDTPRLVYADWLDEHGEPERAEFIRLQCDLARRAAAGQAKPGGRASRRAEELEKAHGERWQAELPVVRGVGWWGFRRGFPGVRATSAVMVVRGRERIWAAAPVELVTLDGLRVPWVEALTGSPVLDRVRALNVYTFDEYEPAAFELLVRSPRLARLRELHASYLLGDREARAIAGSPHLANLAVLELKGNRIGDAGARALAASPHLPALAALDLRDNALSDAGRAAVTGRFPNAKV